MHELDMHELDMHELAMHELRPGYARAAPWQYIVN